MLGCDPVLTAGLRGASSMSELVGSKTNIPWYCTTSRKSLLVGVLVSLLLLFTRHAQGQAPIVPCTPTTPNVLLFAPSVPTMSQTVTVTAGVYRLVPDSISASVVGDVISVALGGHDVGFATAPATICSNVSVGPLPPGRYTLNLVWFYQGVSPSPPTLASTTAFDVVADIAVIPTWSAAAMISTSLLLLMLGSSWLRRRT